MADRTGRRRREEDRNERDRARHRAPAAASGGGPAARGARACRGGTRDELRATAGHRAVPGPGRLPGRAGQPGRDLRGVPRPDVGPAGARALGQRQARRPAHWLSGSHPAAVPINDRARGWVGLAPWRLRTRLSLAARERALAGRPPASWPPTGFTWSRLAAAGRLWTAWPAKSGRRST